MACMANERKWCNGSINSGQPTLLLLQAKVILSSSPHLCWVAVFVGCNYFCVDCLSCVWEINYCFCDFDLWWWWLVYGLQGLATRQRVSYKHHQQVRTYASSVSGLGLWLLSFLEYPSIFLFWPPSSFDLKLKQQLVDQKIKWLWFAFTLPLRPHRFIFPLSIPSHLGNWPVNDRNMWHIVSNFFMPSSGLGKSKANSGVGCKVGCSSPTSISPSFC